MRSWQLCILVGLPMLVTGIAAFVVQRQLEPHYNGRSLSYWLEANSYKPEVAREEAQEALRAMGTNAVPFLLKYMTARPGTWESKIRDVKRKIGLPAED